MDTSKLIIAVVIIVLLGGGAFFYFQNQDGEMDDDDTLQTQVEQASAAPSAMATDQAMMASDGAIMATGTVKEFTVEGSSFKFAPAAMTVNKGDTVKITFKNAGGTHDFVIDELNVKTKQIGSGASETVEFVADKAGTFEYYCSVGNHRAMGMKGVLTVK